MTLVQATTIPPVGYWKNLWTLCSVCSSLFSTARSVPLPKCKSSVVILLGGIHGFSLPQTHSQWHSRHRMIWPLCTSPASPPTLLPLLLYFSRVVLTVVPRTHQAYTHSGPLHLLLPFSSIFFLPMACPLFSFMALSGCNFTCPCPHLNFSLVSCSGPLSFLLH